MAQLKNGEVQALDISVDECACFVTNTTVLPGKFTPIPIEELYVKNAYYCFIVKKET